MIHNILKIAFRSILRDRFYTLINIAGLAIGLACSLLIFSYIHQELSYDRFHPDASRLYRVNQTNIWEPQNDIMGSTALPLASRLQADYPEVGATLRINTPGGQTVRVETDSGTVPAFYEEGVLAADSNLFSFFHIPLQEGDPATALQGKNRVVLSAQTAKKLFGNKSALGQRLLLTDNRIPVEVTGVTAPQPENMHFHFDYMLSIYTNPDVLEFEWSWLWTQVVTYVKLVPGTNATALESKFKVLAEKYVATNFARFNINYKDFMKGKDGWNFYLQPVTDIRLYASNIGNRIGPVSDIKYVYIFMVVALFVSLLAIINFINLSTARGANRAKEVGVRKTLGARRRLLVFQFQTESLILVIVATLLGLCLAELLRLGLNDFLNMQLPLAFLNGGLLWFIPLLIVMVAILAGLYPAIYLTAFRPAQVLKGKLATGFKKSALRNLLVGAQFAISLFFIAGTVVVYQQLHYFEEKDLGFNRDHVIVIDHAEKLGNQLETFRQQLSEVPGVQVATCGMDVPGGNNAFQDVFRKEGSEVQYPLVQAKADAHYCQALGLSLVAGRTFREGQAGDDQKVLLNETAVQLLGWTPREALGKYIYYLGDDVAPQQVIGVIKDFHFQSLNMPIGPLILFNVHSNLWGNRRIIALRVTPGPVNGVLKVVQQRWDALVPDAPLEYNFLDDTWAHKYQGQKRLGGLFAFFTALSVVIAMIGMLGLVTYSAEQRKKEIGVRKVFGASVRQLLVLLNANFTRLLVMAFVLAAPVAWYAMDQWLEQFPYRIDIDVKIFIVSGAIMLVITWLTVSYQSLKAALTNPSDVLKDE